MAEFKHVADTDDVPEGCLRSFSIGYDRVVICHTPEGFFALADECSHDGAPISAGHIDGNQIVCPRHGAAFNVQSGAVHAPPAVVGIDTYQIKIESNKIYVLLD